jgi:hypothetical protein
LMMACTNQSVSESIMLIVKCDFGAVWEFSTFLS